MEQRKEKRIFGIKNISIIDEGKSHPVTLVNLSRKGISVLSPTVFPTFKEIEIDMTIDNHPFKVSGSIRWVNENPLKGPPNYKEIGISLLNPPVEFTNRVAELYPPEE